MVQVNKEQLSSAFWLVFGVLVVLHAPSYGLGILNSPGTGFMPFLAGAAMCIFALIGFIRGIMRGRKGEGWTPILGDMAWSKSFLVLGSLLSYVLLVPYLGFMLCTLMFLGFLFRCVKPMRWRWVALCSVLCTLGAWGVFEVLLKVPLPRSMWGI
jgi:putative tricarboxylic transport membrane protein